MGRLAVRNHYLEQRRELHRHIRENGLADISAAIMIRYQSWLFSIISVFDMLARVARMITCSKCQQRTSRLNLLQ